MIDNYMIETKEIAELLGVELEEEFEIDGTCFKFTNTGLFKYNSNLELWTRANVEVLGRMLQDGFKMKKYILTQKEHEYLSNVVKPFKNEINYIVKINVDDEECICIDFKKDNLFSFPYFEQGTMYQGMEVNKKYTLKELGL